MKNPAQTSSISTENQVRDKDDEREHMKADGLSRKTHLKKLPYRAALDIDIKEYDLSIADIDGDFISMIEDIQTPVYGDGFDRSYDMQQSFVTDSDIFSWCAQVISESPTAVALWNSAIEQGWAIALSCLNETGYSLNHDDRVVTLDHFGLSPEALGRSAYFRNAFLTILIRALRDIWHEERFEPFEHDFAPEQVLMLERIRTADCDSVTVLAVWELRGAGYSDIWRHLIGSAEGDMALIFMRFLERDPTALFDGTALAYTFRQWYADDMRVNACDHDTLESLDDLLEEKGTRNPFGQLCADVQILAELSELPDGMCYLDVLAEQVLSDPYFAGLNDSINQSHLFHLIYDMEVKMVNNVPFRDGKLARKIFPEADMTTIWR